MNSKYITGLSIIAIAALALPVYGLDSYTLPTGKTLNNPHVVSRTPIGIEVAYDEGIIFVKFSDLPADMQKKLKYSPGKESKYRKDVSIKRKKQAKANRAKAKVEAKERAGRELVILERAQVRLGDKIAATKLRVKFLIVEIPKLEAKKASRMDSSTGLASRSSDSNDGGGSSSYYGNTLSSNRGGSNRSERTKSRTINALDNEYQEAKDDLIFSQKELKNKKFDIIKMERLYKRHEVELAAKRVAVNGTKSSTKKSKSFMSGVTNLFK